MCHRVELEAFPCTSFMILRRKHKDPAADLLGARQGHAAYPTYSGRECCDVRAVCAHTAGGNICVCAATEGIQDVCI